MKSAVAQGDKAARAGLCGAVLALAGLAAALLAPTVAAAADAGQTLQLFVASETARLPGRVEVTVGPADERARKAPCAQPEPFIPSGARLWGRTTLGVRCTDGSGWSALLPVQVKVFAPTLIAARALNAGHAPSEADFRIEETDLTREPAPLVSDLAELADQVLARPLGAGVPLRRDQLRQKPAVLQGDPVRLVYSGRGFSVSAFGKALGSSAEGQSVRVQLESGRIVTGTARGGRLVEVGL